jgi:hypothetical protein
MDGPTLATIVCFLSFGVSAFALGGSIYRDVYLKSRLRLVFGFIDLQHGDYRLSVWLA